jgi:hypothetical protein
MGLWQRLDDVMQEYVLVADTGLDRRTLQRARNGHSKPHRRNEAAITRVAGDWARQQLSRRNLAAPRSDVLAC